MLAPEAIPVFVATITGIEQEAGYSGNVSLVKHNLLLFLSVGTEKYLQTRFSHTMSHHTALHHTTPHQITHILHHTASHHITSHPHNFVTQFKRSLNFVTFVVCCLSNAEFGRHNKSQ